MKLRIYSIEGRRMAAARFATVEPLSGNLMHNIEKLWHHRYAN